MVWREHTARLVANLQALGMRRLAILGVVGLAVFLTIGISSVYLARPQFETLYTGLGPQDVTNIGAVLNEAGIKFDVSEDGKTVKVSYGQTARARMLLAEKGLPRSAKAGYELFDNIGSLGLTSFMQEVTLVRALEGELARTIQSIAGVKAARVHIVLQKKSSFRRGRQPPSASVLIRTESNYSFASAEAIRHLVAGAVPGLTVDRVSVLSTDGTMLASGEDRKSAAPRRLVNLEMSVSQRIQQNIRTTLVPYLGAGNFQVSVAARLNTDKRQVSETVFDPASRVERSVREIKEKVNAKNTDATKAVSVEQEIPEKETTGGQSRKSSESRDRKERLTNYEVNSKKISVISDGYMISKLSIAVVVDRKTLALVLGRKLTDAEILKQKAEIRDLVSSAAGFDAKRGDRIKVTVVDFMQSKNPLQPVPAPGYGEQLVKMLPTFINALTFLGVTALVIWFGVRPAVRALATPEAQTGPEGNKQASLEAPDDVPRLESPQDTGEAAAAEKEENLIVDIIGTSSQLPLKRLEQMVKYDEKQAAAVLKEWMREETAA